MGWEVNKWCVVRGEEMKFLIHVLDGDRPLNLSGLTAASIMIKKEDGSILEKAVEGGITWGSLYPLTIYTSRLTSAESSALAAKKDSHDLWLKLVFGENSIKLKFPQALKVLEAGI